MKWDGVFLGMVGMVLELETVCIYYFDGRKLGMGWRFGDMMAALVFLYAHSFESGMKARLITSLWILAHHILLPGLTKWVREPARKRS